MYRENVKNRKIAFALCREKLYNNKDYTTIIKCKTHFLFF